MGRIAASLGLLLLAPLTALAQSSIREFELGGSAQRINDECIRLTPDEPWLTGSAWYDKAIDLSHPFEMRVGIELGNKDVAGADGIVFVFHPKKQTGFRGEGMGFAGLVPSFGIEFDTYQNHHLDDPAYDHIAAMTDGESLHMGPVAPVRVDNLEDGERHRLRIVWTPGGDGLMVELDGTQRATYPVELIRSTFGGTPVVYWGMTAATGRLSNAQDVCIESLLLGRSVPWEGLGGPRLGLAEMYR